MKKKIKDVTIGDIAKECAKHKICDCPFLFYGHCIISYLHRGNSPEDWPEDELGVLEKEVETE